MGFREDALNRLNEEDKLKRQLTVNQVLSPTSFQKDFKPFTSSSLRNRRDGESEVLGEEVADIYPFCLCLDFDAEGIWTLTDSKDDVTSDTIFMCCPTSESDSDTRRYDLEVGSPVIEAKDVITGDPYVFDPSDEGDTFSVPAKLTWFLQDNVGTISSEKSGNITLNFKIVSDPFGTSIVLESPITDSFTMVCSDYNFIILNLEILDTDLLCEGSSFKWGKLFEKDDSSDLCQQSEGPEEEEAP